MYRNVFRLIVIVLSCSFSFTAISQPVNGSDSTLVHGVYLEDPIKISDFSLESTQGGFTQKNLTGHWTLMYFGFTRCMHKCPVSFTALQGMDTKLLNVSPGLKPTELPQVVFVSVDPSRDTMSDLVKFTQHYNAKFIGAKAKLPDLLKLTDQLRVMFHVVDPGNANYTITHSGDVVVINPDGEAVAFLSYPQSIENLFSDYSIIVLGHSL
jgi:protein SCO1